PGGPVGWPLRGEQRVKNIGEPVRAFRVGGSPGRGSPLSAARRRRAATLAGILVSAMLVLVAAAGARWWRGPGYRAEPRPVQAESASVPAQPYTARRLSIVVLPFANLSND